MNLPEQEKELRAAFEAWVGTQPRHEGANLRFLALNNAYIDFEVHGAWLAWQAASSALLAEVEALRNDLRFIERWAVHHARKPEFKAADVLSVIAHYPPIHAITESYSQSQVKGSKG